MTNVEQWEGRLKEINKSILTLRIEAADLEKNIADALCPFKAGDVFVCAGPSNKGRWKVMRIKVSWSRWAIVAIKFNKDGKPGKLERDFSQYDRLELQTAMT